MIKIAIVDTQRLFREGLQNLLEASGKIETVFEAGNGVELLELLREKTVDVILLDIVMPEMSGYDACKLVRQNYPGTKVIALSEHHTADVVKKMMRCGANGFFTKGSDSEDLVNAILSISDTTYIIGKELADVVGSFFWNFNPKKIKETDVISLTARELDVARLAAQNFTSKEIAELLYISVATVMTHRGHIREKTNSKNMVGAVSVLVKAGILNREDL